MANNLELSTIRVDLEVGGVILNALFFFMAIMNRSVMLLPQRYISTSYTSDKHYKIYCFEERKKKKLT
jgi:hypothetical protein